MFSGNRLAWLATVVSLTLAAAGSAAAQEKLTIQIWGTTWQSAFQEVSKAFEQKTGVKVDVVTQSSSGEGLVKLQAMKPKPAVDIWFTTSSVAARAAADQQLFAKIPTAELPSLKGLKPATYNSDWVAAYYYPVGIIYKTKEVKKPITSWADLWAPEFKGQLALPNLAMYQGSMLLVAAVLNGGSVDNVDPGFKAFERIKPNVALFYGSDAQARQAMAQGEVSVLVAPPSQAKRMRDQGIEVKMISPKPAPMLFDVMMLVRSGNEKNALKYIDFVASLEMQELISARLGMAPVSSTAKPSDELVDELPKPGDEVAFDDAKLNANISAWTERFNKEIAR
jgi:putative spermidine/putrescine transport system substrate-binding protein